MSQVWVFLKVIGLVTGVLGFFPLVRGKVSKPRGVLEYCSVVVSAVLTRNLRSTAASALSHRQMSAGNRGMSMIRAFLVCAM